MREKKVMVYLTTEEHRRIRVAAAKENMSMSEYLRVGGLEKADRDDTNTHTHLPSEPR